MGERFHLSPFGDALTVRVDFDEANSFAFDAGDEDVLSSTEIIRYRDNARP